MRYAFRCELLHAILKLYNKQESFHAESHVTKGSLFIKVVRLVLHAFHFEHPLSAEKRKFNVPGNNERWAYLMLHCYLIICRPDNCDSCALETQSI